MCCCVTCRTRIRQWTIEARLRDCLARLECSVAPLATISMLMSTHRAQNERGSNVQHNKSDRGMHTGNAGRSKAGDGTAVAMEVSSDMETRDQAVKYSYSLPENFSLGRGRRGRGKGFVRYSAHSTRSHTKRLQRKRKRELIAKARQMDGVESDDDGSDG